MVNAGRNSTFYDVPLGEFKNVFRLAYGWNHDGVHNKVDAFVEAGCSLTQVLGQPGVPTLVALFEHYKATPAPLSVRAQTPLEAMTERLTNARHPGGDLAEWVRARYDCPPSWCMCVACESIRHYRPHAQIAWYPFVEADRTVYYDEQGRPYRKKDAAMLWEDRADMWRSFHIIGCGPVINGLLLSVPQDFSDLFSRLHLVSACKP